jgi:hypothetical protein
MLTNLLPFREALASVAVKTILPTSLKSDDLMAIAIYLRERARFSAQTMNAEYLQTIDDVIEKILHPQTIDGRTVGMDYATGHQELKQALDRLNYEPTPGKVGTIEDLSSSARLDLVLRTNVEMAHGYGEYVQGMDEEALDQFPAQELFRLESRKEPRDWPTRWADAGGPFFGGSSPDYPTGRMIALKTDPIWEAISAFGLPYPPFDFGSGMWVRDIDALETQELGLLAKGGTQEPKMRDFNDALQMTPDVRDAGLRDELLQSVGDRFHFEGDVLVGNDLANAGQGNWGHAGRPGEVGGSAPGSGSTDERT